MPERLSVPVRVIPRSKANRVDAMRAGRLLVRVAAAPESGAANRAAASLLANALGLRAADVRLEHGNTKRDKEFSIPPYARAALADLTHERAGAGGGKAKIPKPGQDPRRQRGARC